MKQSICLTDELHFTQNYSKCNAKGNLIAIDEMKTFELTKNYQTYR